MIKCIQNCHCMPDPNFCWINSKVIVKLKTVSFYSLDNIFQKLKVVLFKTELEDSILNSMLWMLRITNSFFYIFPVARGKPSYEMVMSIVLDILEKETWTHDGECQQPDGCAQTRRGTGRASWELRTRIPPSAGCAEPTKCSTSSWKKSNFFDYWVLTSHSTSLMIESSWSKRTLEWW